MLNLTGRCKLWWSLKARKVTSYAVYRLFKLRYKWTAHTAELYRGTDLRTVVYRGTEIRRGTHPYLLDSYFLLFSS